MSKRTESVGDAGDNVHYDPESDTYRATVRDGESPTTAVVRALAEIRHCDETELPPLYECIETDALDRLVSVADGAGIRVAFPIDGFDVTVYGDGTINVVPPI
jgi:hypothetical protein